MAKRKAPKKAAAQQRVEPEESEPATTGPKRSRLPVPSNVVLEICAFLHPRDVLYLSRVSKALRADLTTRNAAWAWDQAFRNIELPDRLPNLSGQYYAALVFEAICDICYGKCKMFKDAYWDFPKRVCLKCSRKHFVPVPDTMHGLSKAQIAQVVPTSQKPGASYRKTLDTVLRKVEQEIGGVVDDPAKLAVYIQNTAARVSAVDTHAREVEDWDEKEVTARQKSDAVEARRTEICERLERDGWSRQLARTRKYIIAHPLVAQPKILFDDDWATIKPQLIASATAWFNATLHKKLTKLRKIQRYRRWVMAASVVEDLGEEASDDDIWPDDNDLRRMPELQPILNGGVPNINACASVSGDDVVVELEASSDRDPDADSEVSLSDATSLASFDSANDSFLARRTRQSDPSIGSCENLDDDPTEATASRRHHAHADFVGDDCAWCEAQRRLVTEAIVDRVPAAILAWRQRITEELFEQIPEEVIDNAASTQDKVQFLSRATTVFRCEAQHDVHQSWLCCGGDSDDMQASSLTFYPDALKHRQVLIVPDRYEHYEERTSYGDIECQAELRVAWSPENLEFDEDAHQLVAQLVKSAGLEPVTATRADMEREDARFVCRICANDDAATAKTFIYSWWSCVETAFPRMFSKAPSAHPSSYDCGHDPEWVRVADAAEALVRAMAPRAAEEGEPRAVTFSELDIPVYELLGTS